MGDQGDLGGPDIEHACGRHPRPWRAKLIELREDEVGLEECSCA